MQKSVQKLLKFINEEYVGDESMGSPDVPIGIRDLLTDVIHLCDEYGEDIHLVLERAKDVYGQEVSLMREDEV